MLNKDERHNFYADKTKNALDHPKKEKGQTW